MQTSTFDLLNQRNPASSRKPFPSRSLLPSESNQISTTHLIKIDDRFPELILRLVEIPHADFAEVTGMVFVDVRPVVMLSTGHTTTTRMLSVLAYTAVAGGDVAATRVWELSQRFALCFGIFLWDGEWPKENGT